MRILHEITERLTWRIAAFVTELEFLESAGPSGRDFDAHLESAAQSIVNLDAGSAVDQLDPRCVDLDDIRRAVQRMALRLVELCLSDQPFLQNVNAIEFLAAPFRGNIASQLAPTSSQFDPVLQEQHTEAVVDTLLSECLYDLQVYGHIVVETDELQVSDEIASAAVAIFDANSEGQSTTTTVPLSSPLPPPRHQRSRGLELDDDEQASPS